MKWALVQVCVYLARLMRRRCSVIALSSGMHSQAEFSHCRQKKTKHPPTGGLGHCMRSLGNSDSSQELRPLLADYYIF